MRERVWFRLRLLPLAGCVVALAACGAPTPSPASGPGAGGGCHLAVGITTTAGTTWGAVTATDGSTTLTFTGAARTATVPCGSTVHLTQAATSAATWPFAHWTVGGRTATGASAAVTVRSGTVHVTAVYVLAGAGAPSASPGSSAGGSGW